MSTRIYIVRTDRHTGDERRFLLLKGQINSGFYAPTKDENEEHSHLKSPQEFVDSLSDFVGDLFDPNDIRLLIEP